MKHRTLMLYDNKDFPLACFVKIAEACEYLGLSRDTVNKSLYRGVPFRDGRKLIWVRI